MKCVYVNYLFSISFIFFSFNFCFSEGFGAKTLVKVPGGYTAIENIKVGDYVVCSSSEQKHISGLVIYAGKKHVNHHIRIDVAGESTSVVCDQQFYDQETSKWIAADALQGANEFNGKSVSVYHRNEPLEVYIIGVAQYHNFFVTSSDICAHNFVPAVIVGLSVLFGSGGLELAGVGFGLAGLGTYLGYQWHNKNKQKHAVVIEPQFHGGGIMPPRIQKRRRKEKGI